MFVGDAERERAAVLLREHYVRGRLTLEELSTRTERVLTARSRAELRTALRDLPISVDGRALVAEGRVIAQNALRTAALAVFTGAYLLFSFALFLLLALVLLIHGASDSTLAAFLIVWLVPTFLLSRLWHRRPLHRTPRSTI